jgi:hypothetical protein
MAPDLPIWPQGLLGSAGRVAGGGCLAGACAGGAAGPWARDTPTFLKAVPGSAMKLPLRAVGGPGSAVVTAIFRTVGAAIETCSEIVAAPHAADKRAAPTTAHFNRLIGPVY